MSFVKLQAVTYCSWCSFTFIAHLPLRSEQFNIVSCRSDGQKDNEAEGTLMYMFWANGNKNTRWGFNTFGFYFFTHERGHQHFGCSHKECCFYTSKSDFLNTGNISTHIPNDPQVSPTISATWLNVKSTNGGCVLDPSVWSGGVMLSCCSNFDPWRVFVWIYRLGLPPHPIKNVTIRSMPFLVGNPNPNLDVWLFSRVGG